MVYLDPDLFGSGSIWIRLYGLQGRSVRGGTFPASPYGHPCPSGHLQGDWVGSTVGAGCVTTELCDPGQTLKPLYDSGLIFSGSVPSANTF